MLTKFKQLVASILILTMSSGCMTYVAFNSEDEERTSKDASSSQLKTALLIDAFFIGAILLAYGIYVLVADDDDKAAKKTDDNKSMEEFKKAGAAGDKKAAKPNWLDNDDSWHENQAKIMQREAMQGQNAPKPEFVKVYK